MRAIRQRVNISLLPLIWRCCKGFGTVSGGVLKKSCETWRRPNSMLRDDPFAIPLKKTFKIKFMKQLIIFKTIGWSFSD
jgi:hypothetical protein